MMYDLSFKKKQTIQGDADRCKCYCCEMWKVWAGPEISRTFRAGTPRTSSSRVISRQRRRQALRVRPKNCKGPPNAGATASLPRRSRGPLDGQVLTFQVRSGGGDKLYGSVTSAEIADKLSKAMGFEVDRKHIELEHAIKSLGEHAVPIRLGSGVNAVIQVRVEREAEA
jgi:hypothetical protein